MTDDLPLLLTVRAAADYSGVTREQAYDLVRDGAWGPVVRLSRRQLVSRANVERWVEGMTTPELHIEERSELHGLRHGAR